MGHFGANSGKCYQFGVDIWHHAIVGVVDDLSRLLYVLCLLVVEANFSDPEVEV